MNKAASDILSQMEAIGDHIKEVVDAGGDREYVAAMKQVRENLAAEYRYEIMKEG